MDTKRDSDWEDVEHALQRRNNESTMPIAPAGAQAAPQLITPEGEIAKASGVVAQYKANKITKEAVLEYLKVFHRKQLEVASHHLTEVARMRTAESTAVAEQFLERLNSQQMTFLQDIGLRNLDQRFAALEKLGDQTSQSLRRLKQSDMPPSLREQMINGVMELQTRFFERIMTELGEKRP